MVGERRIPFLAHRTLLALVLCLLSAGGGAVFGLGTGEKGTLKAVTLQLLLPDEGIKDYEGVLAACEKKLKADGLEFKLNVTSIPYDAYYNKLALVAASKEDYDICWVHMGQIAGYIVKGMLAPLNDALKKFAPDIMGVTPEYVFGGVTVKGNIYAIPRIAPLARNDAVEMIRGDLRKKYGIPPITTIAGYEQYLAAIKQNEPSMVPCSTTLREVWPAICPTYHFLDNGYVDLADPRLRVQVFIESAAFKAGCDKMYEWVQKGYRPRDLKVINNDPQSSFTAGKLAACDGNVMWAMEQIETLTANIPGTEIEAVYFNPENPKYIVNTGDNCSAVFAHSAKLAESVTFLNWIRKNQENYDLFSYGVKGVNYHLDGSGRLNYDGIDPAKKYISLVWIWSDMRFHRYSDKLGTSYIDMIKNWDKNANVSPLCGLTLDRTPYQNYLASLDTLDQQYGGPMSGGLVRYDEKKEEMMTKYRVAGIDKVIAEIQKQVDAFLAAKKK